MIIINVTKARGIKLPKLRKALDPANILSPMMTMKFHRKNAVFDPNIISFILLLFVVSIVVRL